MMKRPKSAPLAEILAPTGRQAQTVRGFVSLLGSKGGRRSNRQTVTLTSAVTRSPSKVGPPQDAAMCKPSGVPAFCGERRAAVSMPPATFAIRQIVLEALFHVFLCDNVL
jgi:hypothetical protein